jgi:TPR repeat protein
MYEEGTGVEADLGKAKEFYQEAADGGYAWAQYNLGYLYENGIVVEIDKSEAARLYSLAAGQGNHAAQFAFG